jgi:hypothetical protein
MIRKKGKNSKMGNQIYIKIAGKKKLIEESNHQTHFWKRTIQWLFHQNFVLIEQMVSDKKIFMGISHRVLRRLHLLIFFTEVIKFYWLMLLLYPGELYRTLWEIHIKTILSGTSSSIRTKLWWNSHWMVLFITTQLHCGGHLSGRARLPDTILEEDHPMTIPSKFGSNWATGSRQDGFYVNFP